MRDAAKHREAQRRYAQSEKGKAAILAWNHSETGRASRSAAQARRVESGKHAETQARRERRLADEKDGV